MTPGSSFRSTASTLRVIIPSVPRSDYFTLPGASKASFRNFPFTLALKYALVWPGPRAPFDCQPGGSKGRQRMKRVCLSIVLLAAMVAAASAQDFRGAITGQVTDESGGVLPGVTVTVVNKETKVTSTTV